MRKFFINSVLLVCFTAVIAASVVIARTITAKAEEVHPRCGPHDEVLKSLSDRYGEVPRAMGLAQDHKHILEILTSAKGETWTLLLNDQDGTTCGLTFGEGWTEAKPPKSGAPM